jgi:hypothetical protein
MRLPYKSMLMPIPVVGMSKPLRRSRFCFGRFNVAIPWWRVRYQRLKQMMRDVGHFIDCAIECVFVCFRRLGKSGKLPNELKRRRSNLIIRRRRAKVMKGLDSSAHVRPSTINSQPSTSA